MTTLQRTESIPPLHKFTVLAGDIDQLRQRVEQITAEQSIDDLLDIVEVDALSERFGVTIETMKKRLDAAGGQVFRMGRKFVIRKVRYLEVLELLERS